MNLRAGAKAKATAAFAAAAGYWEAGIEALGEAAWDTDYQLSLQLHSGAAEAASMVGNWDLSDRLFGAVMARAREPIDTVAVCRARIGTLMSQGKLNDAIDAGLELIHRLGVQLKPNPTPEDVFLSLKETMASYDPRRISALIDLPEMTDPRIRAVMATMDAILGPAYSGRPFLHALVCFEQVKLILRHGSTPAMMVAFSSFALRLAGLPFGDIDQGYAFGQLALTLAERGERPDLKFKVVPPLLGCLGPYKRHMGDAVDALPSLYPAAKEAGDFELAGYLVNFYASNAFYAGRELLALERQVSELHQDMKRIRSEVADRWLTPFLQAMRNLLGRSDRPWVVDGTACNREQLLRVLQETKNAAGLSGFHVNTLLLCYLFGHYAEALVASDLALEHRAGLFGLPTEPSWFFYDSLTRLALHDQASDAQRRGFLERVASNQDYLKLRAAHAAENFLHKWHLVEGEKARVLGDVAGAIEHYDRSIRLSRENGFANEEALGNELAARFWLGRGKREFARIYMRRASLCYAAWGATRKLGDLEERYGDLVQAEASERGSEAVGEALDLSTVMKAARAISGEMDFDTLLREVTRIASENAGAQSAFLLLERDGGWEIAVGTGTAEAKEMPLPAKVEAGRWVSPGVVAFVARAKESVVLEDAARSGDFVNDPQIKRAQTKSLLCAPLLSRGRLTGILYLENNLTTHAFGRERVRSLEMLLSQAAVSLENAETYRALKESESRYRRIVDTANEGIWVLGPEMLTASVNARMAEMLGYRPEEMVGRPVPDFMAEEDVADHDLKMENRRGGISEHYQRRFLRRDGQEMWTLASATPVFDDGGRWWARVPCSRTSPTGSGWKRRFAEAIWSSSDASKSERASWWRQTGSSSPLPIRCRTTSARRCGTSTASPECWERRPRGSWMIRALTTSQPLPMRRNGWGS